MRARVLVSLLLEALSPEEAEEVFATYGVPDALTLDKKALQVEYRRLAVQHHPDVVGGDGAAMKAINAAYDVLADAPKRIAGGSRASRKPASAYGQQWRDPQEPKWRKPSGGNQPWDRYPDVPTWAWAGYSGGLPPGYDIYRQSYQDLNYIKKTIWEKSGSPPSSECLEVTLWNFDGAYFRGVFSVFTNVNRQSLREGLWEAAKAMREWDFSHSEAVLVTARDKRYAGLIWVAWHRSFGNVGLHQMRHASFNSNPGNDHEFMDGLSDRMYEELGGTGRRRNEDA